MHNNWNFQPGAVAGAGGPSRWPEAVPPVFSTVSPDAGIGASSSDRGRQTSHHYKMAFPTWTTTTCYVRILYTYHLEPVSWILLVMTSQNSCKNTRFCKAVFSLQELLFKIALLCIFLLKSGLPLFDHKMTHQISWLYMTPISCYHHGISASCMKSVHFTYK